MARIYTDTNTLLDYYRVPRGKPDVLDQLAEYKGGLVLTEQTINEFRRNRVKVLATARTELKKAVELGDLDTTAALRSVPAFAELKKLREQYQRRARAANGYIS